MTKLFCTLTALMFLSCNKTNVIDEYNNKNCKLTFEKSKTSDSLKFKFLQVSEKCTDELEGDILIENSKAEFNNNDEKIHLLFEFTNSNSIEIKDKSSYIRGISCGNYNGKFKK